jgi:hypothetical protein
MRVIMPRGNSQKVVQPMQTSVLAIDRTRDGTGPQTFQ